MDGPSHYRRAEELLADAGRFERGTDTDRSIVAEAQAHGLLALAAAVVAGPASAMRQSDRVKWEQAIDPEHAEREVSR